MRQRSNSSSPPLESSHLLTGRPFVEHLVAAEDEPRLVLLRLDLRLRREAHAQQLAANRLAELGLGQEEKVVGRAAENPQWGDHSRLRR